MHEQSKGLFSCCILNIAAIYTIARTGTSDFSKVCNSIRSYFYRVNFRHMHGTETFNKTGTFYMFACIFYPLGPDLSKYSFDKLAQ